MADRATCPQVVWLASFGDGKRVAGGHRVQHTWINAEADGDPYVQSCLRSYEEEQGLEAGAIIDRFVSGNEMVALVYLQPCAQHHALLPLCREMKAQFDLWNHIGDGGLLDQGLSYFQVLKAQPILHHVSLLDAETKSGRHSCFFCMDKVWAQRCFTASVLGVDDATFQVWRGLTEGKVPLLSLKVPKSIAFLLVNQMWTKLAVPETLTNMRLVAGWHVKHILEADASGTLKTLRDSFAFLPSFEIVASCEGGHVDPSLYNVASSKGKEHMLRLLQTVHGMLFTRGRPPTQEAKEELLTGLLSAARALQANRFSDESFRRQNGFLLKVRKYAPLKLLKFFWVAGSLRNDKDLRDMLKNVCEVSLPAPVAKKALAFIDGDSDGCDKMRVPSTSTVSRIRGRLDVAWTRLMRRWVMERLRVGGGAGLRVFVQTDATWQAKQEYQVTVLNFIDTMDLPLLHKDRFSFFAPGNSEPFVVPISIRAHSSDKYS